jgi:hypothetical protein
VRGGQSGCSRRINTERDHPAAAYTWFAADTAQPDHDQQIANLHIRPEVEASSTPSQGPIATSRESGIRHFSTPDFRNKTARAGRGSMPDRHESRRGIERKPATTWTLPGTMPPAEMAGKPLESVSAGKEAEAG